MERLRRLTLVAFFFSPASALRPLRGADEDVVDLAECSLRLLGPCGHVEKLYGEFGTVGGAG
jgi:hypothetical protein